MGHDVEVVSRIAEVFMWAGTVALCTALCSMALDEITDWHEGANTAISFTIGIPLGILVIVAAAW